MTNPVKTFMGDVRIPDGSLTAQKYKVLSTLIDDAELSDNQYTPSLDETNDALLFKAKDSTSRVQIYTVTPGGLEILTSSDDGVADISAVKAEHILLEGTGINYTVPLPNATTLYPKRRYVFENASSEFVGITFSDGSGMVRLGPHESVVYRLITKTTAVGLWFVQHRTVGPEHGVEEVESGLIGIASITGGKFAWNNTKSGVGYVSGFTASNSDSVFGRLFNRKGTDIAGYTALHLYAATISMTVDSPTALSLTFGSVSLVNGLATLTENYWCELGLGDTFTEAAHTDCIALRYDIGIPTGGANWHRVIAAGAGEVITDTGIVAVGGSATFNDMIFEVSSAHTRVDFWIGNQHAGSGVAGIPTAYLGPFMRIIGRDGANTRDFNAKYMRIKSIRPGGI